MFLAVFGPVFWTIDPDAADLNISLQPPSWAHPMGTDSLGRDVFARFNEGARISLVIGAIVVVAGALLGGAIGVLAGAFGGWKDNSLMRVMDSLLAFPPLILAMAVTVGLGVGLKTATLGVILTTVPYYARLCRSDVLRVRSLQLRRGGERARRASRLDHAAPHRPAPHLDAADPVRQRCSATRSSRSPRSGSSGSARRCRRRNGDR